MKKETRHLLFLSLFVIAMTFLFGFVYKMTGADIVSVNNGGTSNVSVNSDIFTEGFFSNPTTPPTENQTGGTGGTPGAGGGGGGTILTSNISINPSQFNLNMLINTNLPEIVTITNVGANSRTISVGQTNLTNLIIIGNTTLTLGAGQSTNLNLIFVAPNTTGIYNGTINIGDRVIPVSLNVVKQFILFDSNIVVLNKNYRVPKGELLKTQVTMIPMGENVRMDVTLNYTIQNTNGTVYTTRSETLLVTSQQTLGRTFDTGNLPIGNYTIGLELIYPYGVAPSSAYFGVINNSVGLFSEIIYWLLITIVLVSIAIIILRIIKSIRRARKNS